MRAGQPFRPKCTPIHTIPSAIRDFTTAGPQQGKGYVATLILVCFGVPNEAQVMLWIYIPLRLKDRREAKTDEKQRPTRSNVSSEGFGAPSC